MNFEQKAEETRVTGPGYIAMKKSKQGYERESVCLHILEC